MDKNELKAMANKYMEGVEGARPRSFSIKVANASADTDDKIYIATSYDLLPTENGHPVSLKGVAEETFTVETHPASVTNFVESIKHGRYKILELRLEASDAATMSSTELEVTKEIGLFSPKGRKEYIQASDYIDPNAENRDIVVIKNPPFDLCPTTNVLINVPYGKFVKATYRLVKIED